MQAAIFANVNQVTASETGDPDLQSSRDAIVKVSMAGLCGSDLHPFFGRELGLDCGTVMGHELVGTIVAIGDDVAGFQIGDRVCAPFSTNCGDCHFCRTGLPSRCEVGQLFGWVSNGNGLEGCQSEFVRVPLADATLMKLPESVSDEAALLLGDNFSTGFYCAEMADAGVGKSHVVIGCGTVGQLCILAARSMGAEQIIAVDPVESRRQQAAELGARGVAPDKALDEVHAMTLGRGADCVMELVGLPDAQQLAFQAIRPGGTMSVIGCHCTPNFQFSPVDAYDKNLTYRTGRCPARHYMDLLTPRVAAGEFSLEPFITHQFPLADATRAYDVFANRKDNCRKAVFVIN